MQLDVQAAIPEREAPPPTVGEQLSRRVYIRRSVELAKYGYTDRCIGCQHARLGLKLADHNEECRARIVRHMTADDNFNQRVQIAQDRIVETTPPEARTGERDPVPEPARKKVRFAERVEEQTLEGTVATNSRSPTAHHHEINNKTSSALMNSFRHHDSVRIYLHFFATLLSKPSANSERSASVAMPGVRVPAQALLMPWSGGVWRSTLLNAPQSQSLTSVPTGVQSGSDLLQNAFHKNSSVCSWSLGLRYV